jgi:hypothetical protein
MNDTAVQTKRPTVTTVIKRPADCQLALIEHLLTEHHDTVHHVALNFTVMRGAATTETGELVGVKEDKTVCIFRINHQDDDWCLTGFDPEVHTIVEGRLRGSVTDKWSRGQLTWTHR